MDEPGVLQTLRTQLVRNGVMAYAVFQGWGNDPVAFETGKNKDLLDEVEKLYGADDGAYPIGSTDRIDTLVGATAAPITELPTWNYIVRTPKAQIIVLDTRTRRKFTGEGYLPADLVGLNREAQLPAGPTTDGREVTFVISAAPVFGPDMVEQLAWPLAQVMIDGIHFGKGLDAGGFQQGEVGRERYDAEGWSTNELAREELFKRLATYPAVVLLGGDVHFAYTAVLDYYRKGAKDPSRLFNSRRVRSGTSPSRRSSSSRGRTRSFRILKQGSLSRGWRGTTHRQSSCPMMHSSHRAVADESLDRLRCCRPAVGPRTRCCQKAQHRPTGDGGCAFSAMCAPNPFGRPHFVNRFSRRRASSMRLMRCRPIARLPADTRRSPRPDSSFCVRSYFSRTSG